MNQIIMKFDTEDYDAQELQMLFDEICKIECLKTKVQFAEFTPKHRDRISRKGVDKRLKSVYSPQTFNICGITLISDKPVNGSESDYYIENHIEEPLKLVKFKDKYF